VRDRNLSSAVKARHKITSGRSVCNHAFASSLFSAVKKNYGTNADFYNKKELVQSRSFVKNIITVRLVINILKYYIGGEKIWALDLADTMVVTAVVIAAVVMAAVALY
jgi:hypothetical protein